MSANVNRCPRCNTEAQPGTRYCANCGYDLQSAPAAAPAAPAPGPQPAPGWQGSAAAKQKIMEAVQGRGATDEIIPEWWIILPILFILVGVFGGLAIFFYPAAGIVLTIAAWIVAVIFALLIIYKLLKRHNLHLAREAALRRAMIDFFKFKAEEKGVGYQVYPSTQNMEAIDREAYGSEKPQDALLWTILTIIPIIEYVALILIFYWLTNFSPGHDRRFYAFAQNAQAAGSQVGMNITLPQMWRPVPERSFLLYFILTIITFGLFGIYWVYVLIKDLNEHFKNEWEFEDRLVAELQRA